MSLTGFTPVADIPPSSLVATIVDSVNENSQLTNALLVEANAQDVIIQQLGDVTNLSSSFSNLVDQSNYNYAVAINASVNQGNVIEYLPVAPTITDPSTAPLFYFNTTFQTLMVWHTGDGIYVPAFGGQSILDQSLTPANDWMAPVVVMPPVVVTPPAAMVCYSPAPNLNEGTIRHIRTLPANSSVLGAATKGNSTFILLNAGNNMDLYKYDILSDNLSVVMSLPFYRKDCQILIAADELSLFIVGGSDANNLFSNSVQRIDLATLTATAMPNFPVAFDPSDVSYDSTRSKAYFFGGAVWTTGSAVATNSIYELDMVSGVSMQIGLLPYAVEGASSTDIPDANGLLYIIGGRLNNSGTNASIVSTIISFDPITGITNVVSNLPSARSDGQAYLGTSEIVYVGGYKAASSNCIGVSQDIFRIFPFGSSWSVVQSGSVNSNSLRTFGSVSEGCGYATYIVSNTVGADEIFIVGV